MALTKLRISYALKFALPNSKPKSTRSTTTWSVSLMSNVADVAAETSQTMPYCYSLDNIISGDMRNVTDGSVPSGCIISNDMHDVKVAKVLNSYNTCSDHRLMRVTLYVIHRLRPLSTNRDFENQQA
uniref:Uncharacterized protein n=1 Tax=Plectus sambesii TaxID=2011161 RepID=A0A914WBU1_9BILA